MNGTNYDKSTLNFLTTEKGRTQNKMDYAMTRGFYRQALSSSELTQIKQVQGGLVSVPGTIGFMGTRCCAPSVKPAPTSCIPISLNTIATYLRNYMPEFRNSNFWAYQCDANEYYIEDGGNDMFDSGNFTTPWLLSDNTYVTDSDIQADYPYAIGYLTTTQTLTDTDFNYVSLGYVQGEPENDNPQTDDSRHPLTVLGFRCSGPVGWQIGGELGADGNGETINSQLYSGQTINGFTVYSAYRQVYDAGDPSVCNLIILLGHSRWGSIFGPTSTYADGDTNSCGFYYYAGSGSKNILAIQTLLSIPEGDDESPIPDSELQTVVFNFTRRIGESLGY